jgi:hypothetical protein
MLFLGGSFTKAIDPSTGASRGYQNLAAVDDRTGKLVGSFAPHTFNGMVYAVAVDIPANLLYVGGNFTTVDGSAVAADHLAAFDITSGARIPSFAAQVDASVRALVYDGSTNRLYLGGRFTAVQQQQRAHLAAVDPVSGALSADFDPPVLGWTETPASRLTEVRALTVGADASGRPSLYVGGHFDTVDGRPQQSLVRVDLATGALDAGFLPQVDAAADDDLQAVDKILWLDSTSAGGPGIVVAQAGHLNRAYRFDLAGHRTWYLRPNGDVQTAVLYGNVVYLGGHFRCIAAGGGGSSCYSHTGTYANRTHIAAVNVSTGAILSSFRPQMDPKTKPYYFGVWNLRITSGGRLWAAGVFKAVTYQGRTYNRPKLAAFQA